MTVFVPYDGRPLSNAALVRGATLADALEATLLTGTVIPRDVAYATERGWLPDDATTIDVEAVRRHLQEQIARRAPEAASTFETVGAHAPPGAIASELRRMAAAADAELVVIGSENAGHMVASITSVGSGVAADDDYDVVIVRHRLDE